MGLLKISSPGSCALRLVLLGLLFVPQLVGLGCSREENRVGRYAAHGIVEDVDLEGGQILIDHEDVEGLMPAMTMNFAVRDRELLERLAPGQVIDFEIDFTGRSYDVVEARVVDQAPAAAGWRRLRDGLVRSSPAPGFDLIDQFGNPVSLETFSDRVLLVDFIFTSCPGPCPVQTSNQVALQKQIPMSVRDRVQFISISLDPAVDTPERLERYALDRGADLANWSFLTGPVETVSEIVRAWGIGSIREPDGTIDHTLITFLVFDGRVFERYSPADAGDGKILAGLLDLAGRAGAIHDSGSPGPDRG